MSNFERPKKLTEEQIAKTKERILSDAELVKGGAEIRSDGVIQPTEEQRTDAKIEMGDHFYKKAQEQEKKIEWLKQDLENQYTEQRELSQKLNMETEVNGTKIKLYWEKDYIRKLNGNDKDPTGIYAIYFPGNYFPGKDKEDVRISANDEDAKKVFEYAREVASKETDINEIIEQIEEYKNSLQ